MPDTPERGSLLLTVHLPMHATMFADLIGLVIAHYPEAKDMPYIQMVRSHGDRVDFHLPPGAVS